MTITEYAKVAAGVVTSMIIADQTHVDARSDGPWILTPYDGSTGKVGIGYTYDGTTFAAPVVIVANPPTPLPYPDPNLPLP